MFSCFRNQVFSIIARSFKEINVTGIPAVMQTCNATKKAGGQARKQGKPRRGKRRGVKTHDGFHVKSGQILVRQLGFKFHPGKNVGHARDHTLYALCEGYVKFTHELMQPFPFKLAYHPKDYVERRFINVIERPKPRHLVCTNEHERTNIGNKFD